MADYRSLGRLVAVHPVAPAAMQRAVFIAVLSFLFFLAMMFAYYLRQEIGYFLLATAFLTLYLAMMFAILVQRKSTVEVRENGLRWRKNTVRFEEVESVSDQGEVTVNGKPLLLPKSVANFDTLLATIRGRIS